MFLILKLKGLKILIKYEFEGLLSLPSYHREKKFFSFLLDVIFLYILLISILFLFTKLTANLYEDLSSTLSPPPHYPQHCSSWTHYWVSSLNAHGGSWEIPKRKPRILQHICRFRFRTSPIPLRLHLHLVQRKKGINRLTKTQICVLNMRRCGCQQSSFSQPPKWEACLCKRRD